MESHRFIEVAFNLVAQRRLAEAKAILEKAISEMPTDWRPVQVTDEGEIIYCWNEDEFLAYCEYRNPAGVETPIIWRAESYSHAYYWLAHICIEEGSTEAALFALNRGLTLEPDHPELLCEKGYVFQLLKRHGEALRYWQEAESVRPWAPATQKARSLRGQAFNLIELNQLEKARQALQRSLQFEPDNANAKSELAYLEKLRRQEEEPPRLPWFVHAIVHPPSDPLTVSLLQWVEDLPSIPGPKTVGRENYSRISEAFHARGWEGFEEEFSKLFPDDHPNHRQIKEDLLREPIFRPVVHQRMALLFEAAAEGGKDAVKRAMESIREEWKRRKPTS